MRSLLHVVLEQPVYCKVEVDLIKLGGGKNNKVCALVFAYIFSAGAHMFSASPQTQFEFNAIRINDFLNRRLTGVLQRHRHPTNSHSNKTFLLLS